MGVIRPNVAGPKERALADLRRQLTQPQAVREPASAAKARAAGKPLPAQRTSHGEQAQRHQVRVEAKKK
jgi:hypothetical protein